MAGGGRGARGQLPEVKDRSEQAQARGRVGTWDPSRCSGHIPHLPTEEEHVPQRSPPCSLLSCPPRSSCMLLAILGVSGQGDPAG